jgi:hypothetical protein
MQDMWVDVASARSTVKTHVRRRNMLEVSAQVCMWPNLAGEGATGLLHGVVRHCLDVNLYSSTLLQVTALLSHQARLKRLWPMLPTQELLDIAQSMSHDLQAIILLKWRQNVRNWLLLDIAVYVLQMVLFVCDLSIVGLTMGRTLISNNRLTRNSAGIAHATAHGLLDMSPYGLTCSIFECVILIICAKNLGCVGEDHEAILDGHALRHSCA